MLMTGIEVVFIRLSIAWGRGDKRNGLPKQHCQLFLTGAFRVYLPCEQGFKHSRMRQTTTAVFRRAHRVAMKNQDGV